MEDEGIIALLWARDEAGLRAAEEKYGPVCRALGSRILGSPEDGEECWNDALLRLWTAVPPEKPARLRAWLLKLTRGIAIDRFRSARAEKRGGGELPLLLEELGECVPGSSGAEGDVLVRELGEAVNRFLRGQAPEDRSLFLRRYFYGESVSGLAEALGMRRNTVSARLSRIRARLRAWLEKEGLIP